MSGGSSSVIAPEPSVREGSDRTVRSETRGASLRRHTHRAGLNLAARSPVVRGLILVALTAANTRQVKLNWLLGSGTASLVWIVLASAILGGAIGVVSTGVFRWRTRAPRR